MAKHEVTIHGYTERPGDTFTESPPSILGIIGIKPPIAVGPRFNDAVLGRDKHGVGLSELVSTADETILVAGADLYGDAAEGFKKAIERIRERIASLVDNPADAVRLMDENPFPEPYERM